MSSEEIFSGLGFNTLEAEVYVALLKNGPNTAYKVGKLLGRPTANVYKAVDVLAAQGAVEVMETDVKVCKAVPIETLVRQLRDAYNAKTDKAVEALKKVQEERSDEGIFKLKTVQAVLQRAKEIMEAATSIVVIDVFPNLMNLVKEDINLLAERGITVYVQAYEPVELHEKVNLVIPNVGAEAMAYWDAEQLNIVADGNEMLISLFNKDADKLIQATYSNNTYISCIMHAGIMSEHKVHQFSMAATIEEVNAIKESQRFFLNTNLPGLSTLFSQYRIK